MKKYLVLILVVFMCGCGLTGNNSSNAIDEEENVTEVGNPLPTIDGGNVTEVGNPLPTIDGGNVTEVGNPTITGTVAKGAVHNAAVTIYELTHNGFGEVLAETTTDENGRYSVELDVSGPIAVVAIGGTYIDEASHELVDIDAILQSNLLPTASDNPLECASMAAACSNHTASFASDTQVEEPTIVPSDLIRLVTLVAADTSHEQVSVTPLTTIAASRTLAMATATNLNTSIVASQQKVADLFKIFDIDIVGVSPTNFSSEEIISELDTNEAQYGLVLAGLSQTLQMRTPVPAPSTLLFLIANMAADYADNEVNGRSFGAALPFALGSLDMQFVLDNLDTAIDDFITDLAEAAPGMPGPALAPGFEPGPRPLPGGGIPPLPL
ncbi:MAG: carboxypeptidase-like regulatory domain-containing protein [Pseudomonadota bacterium]